MDPVLFSYQTFTIYTFGFSLTVAALVGAFLLWRRMRRFTDADLAVIDMVLVSGVLALVFARLFYLVMNWADFQNSFLRMVLVTYFPGLDGLGAMFGVIVAVCVFTYIKGWKALDVFDSVLYALGLSIVIIMMGSFFSGSLPGVETSLAWGTVYPGLQSLRHPMPIYWMLLSIGYFVAATWLDRVTSQSGVITAWFCACFGAGLVGLNHLTMHRGELARYVTYGAGGLLLVLGALLTYRLWQAMRIGSIQAEKLSSDA